MGSEIKLGRTQLSNGGGLASLNGSGGFDITPLSGQPTTENGPTIINPVLDTQVALLINAHSASQSGKAFQIKDFAGNDNITIQQYIPNNALAANNTLFVRGQHPKHMIAGPPYVDTYIFHVRGAGQDPSYDAAYITSTATSGTATTLVDTTQNWIVNQYIGYRVKITSGTGNTESALITANTSNTLTVASWSIATPDATSHYTINGDASQAEAGQYVARFHFVNAGDPPYNTNYGGSYSTGAGNFQNDSIGTAATPISKGFLNGNQAANAAILALSAGLGTGWNLGGYACAENSPVNIGLLGYSINAAASSTAQNFGVWGIAQNTLGGTRVAGYFAITNTEPTGFISSVLQADNFGSTVNIFTASRNNTARFSIDQYGACTVAPLGQTGGVTALTIQAGSYSTVTTEVNDILYPAHTMVITGAITTQRFAWLRIPTISAATSLTVATAATLAIEGAPAATGAGPAVITTPLAFWIQAGDAQMNNLRLTKITRYNNIATLGTGIPVIYGYVRPVQQTNTTVTLATFTPTADASVEVSCNVSVTVATSMSMSVTVTYFDENNTSQTLTFPLVKVGTEAFLLNGLIIATGIYSGMPFPLRVKANTAITMQTAGTVTTTTYQAEGKIVQTA